MKLYQEGDKSKAICEDCAKIVNTTFAIRDVPFSDRDGVAKGILVATCDCCGRVVAIPAQSTPKIKAARARHLYSVEAQLPYVYLDVLDLACQKLAEDADLDMRKRLVSYYIHQFASGEYKASCLASLLSRAEKEFPVSKIRHPKRFSFKVREHIFSDLNKLVEVTSLSKTKVLQSVTFQIKEDVLEEKNSAKLPELRSLMFGC